MRMAAAWPGWLASLRAGSCASARTLSSCLRGPRTAAAVEAAMVRRHGREPHIALRFRVPLVGSIPRSPLGGRGMPRSRPSWSGRRRLPGLQDALADLLADLPGAAMASPPTSLRRRSGFNSDVVGSPPRRLARNSSAASQNASILPGLLLRSYASTSALSSRRISLRSCSTSPRAWPGAWSNAGTCSQNSVPRSDSRSHGATPGVRDSQWMRERLGWVNGKPASARAS